MFYKNEYISYLIQERGLSHTTVNILSYLVNRLERFLISQGINHVKDAKLPAIEKYFALIQNGLNSRGVLSNSFPGDTVF